MLYVQFEQDSGQVIGYSSNKMHENDIIVNVDDLEERFFTMPIFYNLINGEVIFDEERYNLYKIRKENNLTDQQRLGQKCSDLEIQMLMLQQMLMMQQQMK